MEDIKSFGTIYKLYKRNNTEETIVIHHPIKKE